jgi:hypothetical protein
VNALLVVSRRHPWQDAGVPLSGGMRPDRDAGSEAGHVWFVPLGISKHQT